MDPGNLFPSQECRLRNYRQGVVSYYRHSEVDVHRGVLQLGLHMLNLCKNRWC